MHTDTQQARHLLERQTASGKFVTLPGSQQDAHAWSCQAVKLYTDITLCRSQDVVPHRVRQDDHTALPFLQLPGSLHSHSHGTARASTT